MLCGSGWLPDKTNVEITKILAPPHFSAPCGGLDIEWHIHIGEADFKALQHSGWDSQICYVDVLPEEGEPYQKC